jgi:ubiquinol-cytochrome c reductase cytochrome b subunit
VTLLLGGRSLQAQRFALFRAARVAIPGLLIAAVGVHLLLVLKIGINRMAHAGRIVRRATYVQEYQDLTHRDGEPFVPYAVWKDIVFSGVILLAIAVCAAVFGPFGPSGQPDPTIIQDRATARLLLSVALRGTLVPASGGGTPLLLIAPVIAIIVLVGLPFYAGKARKLEAKARGRPLDSTDRLSWRINTIGRAYTVESHNGRMEQHADIFSVLKGGSGT